MFVQATVAILILVGFESVTALGGEAKNAKRDVPIAVITSLLVQGAFCYLFEYFAANYFLNSGYPMSDRDRLGRAHRRHDGHGRRCPLRHGHGRTFMLIEAVTVFLALIGTTLSCINTGARVTYAMGKDNEVPEHFGMLHDKNLSPHRAIWALAIISAIFGCIALLDALRRCRRPPGRHDPGPASWVLVELRVRVSRHDGEVAQQPAHDHSGLQLRDVPALHAELRNLHLLLQRTPELQLRQAHAHPDFRHRREPDLHGQPTSCCRSWGMARRWSRFWPWESQQSGASTAASTSRSTARSRGKQHWSPRVPDARANR